MVTIKFKTDNEAFSDSDEIRRILYVAAEKIAFGEKEGKLFDINGNSVGTFKVTK